MQPTPPTLKFRFRYLPFLWVSLFFSAVLYGNSAFVFLKANTSPLQSKTDSLITKSAAFSIGSPVANTINISDYCFIYIDSLKQAKHGSFITNPKTFDFLPLSFFEFGDKYERGKHAYWLLFDITNASGEALDIGVDLGVFDSIQTFVYLQDDLIQRNNYGNRGPTDQTGNEKFELTTYFTTTLEAGRSYTFLSRIANAVEINREIKPVLIQPTLHEKKVFSRFAQIFSFQAAFLAVLLIVFVINLFQYMINKDQAFIYYSAYILLLFLFFFRDFNCTSPIALFGLTGICSNTYVSPLVVGNFICYAFFVMAFLETKKKEPQLHKGFKIGITICVSFMVLERIVAIWDPFLSWKLYGYFKIVILCATMVILFMVYRIKNPLSFFIITGTLSLLIATIVTAFLSFEPVHFVNYLDTTYIPQYVGIVLELLFFSIGLGYKTKQTEYERRKAKTALKLKTLEMAHERELGMVRNRFFTQITHEFRTPLTVILGMADNLKSGLKNLEPANIKNSLEIIKRNGHSLLRMINDLLDISKLESGNMEVHYTHADVIAFVKYVCESFKSLAQESKIKLLVHNSVTTLFMDFDPDKLSSVISNLLSNAIKFTPEGGKIDVFLSLGKKGNGDYLTISVSDSGIGIPEKSLPHIFDRFYQAENASLSRSDGTGIGLALTKEFVQLVNGTITVKSEPGEGSQFNIEIPITHKAKKITIDNLIKENDMVPIEKGGAIVEVIPEANAELPLALVIEDNPDVAQYIQKCLLGKYGVLYAIDGKQGVEMSFENMPDIIISDIMMPKMDGYEVCRILKNDQRTDHIPIVLLTAKATDEDRITGLSFGADAYLTKPFNKKELLTRIEQLVLLRKKMISKIEKQGVFNFLEERKENVETKFLNKVLSIINEEISNYTLDSHYLAKKLNLSDSQTYRKLKAITGKSTAVFIRSVRLQKAKELILSTDKAISEIAYDVGFNDPSWFSRVFKDEFGFTPSSIQK